MLSQQVLLYDYINVNDILWTHEDRLTYFFLIAFLWVDVCSGSSYFSSATTEHLDR